MKKSRFTEEQIIGFLKEAEAGAPVTELNDGRLFSISKKESLIQINKVYSSVS